MDGKHENKSCLKLSERSSKLVATVCSVLKRMAEVMKILDGVLRNGAEMDGDAKFSRGEQIVTGTDRRPGRQKK